VVKGAELRAIRFVARAFVLAFFLGKQFFAWFFGWLALLLTFRGKKRRQDWFAARLLALFRDLGATFIKVGQIMSTRPDLFPPHIIRALERLQDQVGAFPYRHVEQQFLEEFGAAPDALFKSFSREPIASASVAQVHRAELDDGTVLAVKVRRRKLEQIVRFDLQVMRLFAKIASIVPSIGLMAPVESVDEFGKAIYMQIDFTIEAENNRRFRTNFGDDPDVDFPHLIPELCSKRILTMTFIDGVKVLDFKPEISDPKRLARIGFKTLLKMVFEDGFVHADLHPGNIFVTDADQVVILDLGLVAELDDLNRRIFAQFFAAWAMGDAKTMAKIMVQFSPRAKVPDYDVFEKEVVEFVARYWGKQLGQVQVSQVAFDMMNILRRHRVRANATFTMVNIAIAVTEGIGRQLAPELDLMTEAMPFFAKANLGAPVASN
jgi:ubiquinone biosynthesis protein